MFYPGHDARVLATSDITGLERVNITFDFTIAMDCDAVTRSISFETSSRASMTPTIRSDSISCVNITDPVAIPDYNGILQSSFRWSGELENVSHGVLAIYVTNPGDASGTTMTHATDKFLLRVGLLNNPMVFPATANYSESLISPGSEGMLTLSHTAPGAELWRYTTNWGSSYSGWMPYSGGDNQVLILPWNGTDAQAWDGRHARVEYWNHLAGSADHVVMGDMNSKTKARRFPHLFAQGPFNEYGFDAGQRNVLSLIDPGTWSLYFLVEWPAILQ